MCRRALAGIGLIVLSSGALAASTPSDETAEPGDRPRIGLVLAGGGARGGAHVGVLSVLEEMRIPIDCIAGTSMGALVGATYAVGTPAARIERHILNIDWSATLGSAGRRSQLPMQRKLAGITYSNNIELGISSGHLHGVGGLVSTQKMEGLFRLLVGDARTIEDFDELAIPFRAVATDLAKGEMVVIGSGDLTRAMRASMAVPGVFAPVVVGDAVLADGGMIRNLPVDVARDLCADVVIAVSLEMPQPRAEEMRSMFALAGRSIDAMIMANEQLQLATLTERDVRIVVPTESLGSGQFERVPETIPLGVASARAAAASLARYSVSEAEYRAWRASLDKRETTPVQVEAIQFRPLRHATAEYLATRIRTRPGEKVSRAALESDIDRIFSSGDFERIDYRLLPSAGDGRIVEIDAVERYGGTDFVRFDLGLAGSSGGDVLYVIRADHRREWVNTLGGQWRNALQLGTLSEVTTAFYQPLDVAQRFFIEPGIVVRRSLENFFDDGRRVARYDLFEGALQLDAGFNLSNHTRLTAGLRWGVTEFDEDIGRIEVFDLNRRRDANMVFAALYDTRDAAVLPTSGTFAKVELTSSGNWLGGERSYDVVEAVASQVIEFGGSPLVLSAGAGRTIGGDLPRHRDFQLGGIRSLPAFAPGELRGEGYWAASASWALSLLEFQPVFKQSLYGGVGLHAVRMTDRIDSVDVGVILGVSLTLAARTPIGPLLVSAGAADNGNLQLHFAIGRPIAEGSLLDRLH